MHGEPWFWREETNAARVIRSALRPAAGLYGWAQSRRIALTRPARAPLPVLCIGAARIGGVGKTPFARLLHDCLCKEGVRTAFLLRGYGGREKGPLRVALAQHDAQRVGDEARLLATTGPTWIAADRPSGAVAIAEANGRAAPDDVVDAIIMDDGHQNPALEKTVSFLVTANQSPAEAGALFPAGPLREGLPAAAARADAIVVVKAGADEAIHADMAPLAEGKPLFPVWPAPVGDAADHQGRFIAFSGIANPERFFSSLAAAGGATVGHYAFPDHHLFTDGELSRLANEARRANARLVTTEKDAARLTPAWRARVRVFSIALQAEDAAALAAFAGAAVAQWRRRIRAPHPPGGVKSAEEAGRP